MSHEILKDSLEVEKPEDIFFTIVLTSVSVELTAFAAKSNKLTDKENNKLISDITKRVIRVMKENNLFVTNKNMKQ